MPIYFAITQVPAYCEFRQFTQEPGRTYRLGDLHLFPRNIPFFDAFFDELKRYGFIEGQNLSIDQRGCGLHVDQLAESTPSPRRSNRAVSAYATHAIDFAI